jgi:RecB family exonuclease
LQTIRRVFLGWDTPLLGSAVDHFLATQRQDGPNRTRQTLVVLPVVRAARRFEQILSRVAAESGGTFVNPRMMTVGDLPEHLYQPQGIIANEMQSTLAWTQVLLDADAGLLAPLMPSLPTRDSPAAWMEMAGTLKRLCQDLVTDAISPESVAEIVEADADRSRWLAIGELYQRYLSRLEGAGLFDPHQQRMRAIADANCRAPGPILLVGCVDIGFGICKMLEQVADSTTAVIGAPDQAADLFDLFGRVNPGRWDRFPVEIPMSQIVSAGDSGQQGAAAAEIIQGWQHDPSTPQSARTTVGICDNGYGPQVETDLALAGFSVFRLGGLVIAQTAVGHLLRQISDFLQSRRWDAMAALLRHHDVLTTFASSHGSTRLLAELDAFRSSHFVVRFDDPWPSQAADQKAPLATLRAVTGEIANWLSPLESKVQPFARWCADLVSLLTTFYEPLIATDQSATDPRVIDDLTSILERMSDLPESLDVHVPAWTAIDMVLQRISDPRTLGEPDRDQLQIAGWLDLPFDDADQMVVIGMNHPFVPQAVTADPFLPGSLRTRLSVADNERRFARDLYILQVIFQTRSRSVFIVGRSGPDGSPTPPSRLLAACPSHQLLQRVDHLLAKSPLEPRPQFVWGAGTDQTDLPIPDLGQVVIPGEVSVTAFRSYLECPYRFYLRHVLHLRPLDDSASELAANQFGDLVHAAVERFGDCDDKNLTEVSKIEASVIAHLHDYADATFGAHTTAAVRLQITQAEKRLRIFATRQAERMQEGWRIHRAEAAVRRSDGAVIQCDGGKSLAIKGRIDRIDFHPQSGRWAILDYKTHGHKPLEKHFSKSTGTWIDLQLPLYLLMLKALRIDAPFEDVEVGYFNIPDDPKRCGVHPMQLDEAFRKQAFAQAKQVAERILRGDFSPQLDASKVPYDDYPMILQTGVMRGGVAGGDRRIAAEGITNDE